IEDESRLIGCCAIPNPIFIAMRKAPLIVINSPVEERVNRIVQLYGNNGTNWWIEQTKKIQKRLGGACTQKIIECIQKGLMADAIQLLLPYYDRAYQLCIEKHQGPVIYLTQQKL